jgi:hypothetical protein
MLHEDCRSSFTIQISGKYTPCLSKNLISCPFTGILPERSLSLLSLKVKGKRNEKSVIITCFD